jgi:hypothetical protein
MHLTGRDVDDVARGNHMLVRFARHDAVAIRYVENLVGRVRVTLVPRPIAEPDKVHSDGRACLAVDERTAVHGTDEQWRRRGQLWRIANSNYFHSSCSHFLRCPAV